MPRPNSVNIKNSRNLSGCRFRTLPGKLNAHNANEMLSPGILSPNTNSTRPDTAISRKKYLKLTTPLSQQTIETDAKKPPAISNLQQHLRNDLKNEKIVSSTTSVGSQQDFEKK
jgi:hypothetical protein